MGAKRYYNISEHKHSIRELNIREDKGCILKRTAKNKDKKNELLSNVGRLFTHVVISFFKERERVSVSLMAEKVDE